jgi:hypothetical protein
MHGKQKQGDRWRNSGEVVVVTIDKVGRWPAANQPARMEEVDRVHRQCDHAAIEDVEVDLRVDNVTIPANAKLCIWSERKYVGYHQNSPQPFDRQLV